jgi:hypothetical protein
MPYRSLAQERYFHANKSQLEKQGVNVSEWDKSSKGMKLPKRVKKHKKLKIKVDNKLKAYGEEDDKNGQIKINIKKHKGNKSELADTIRHELIHLHHPKMHEKTVYKKTKGEMRSAEINKFLKLLKNK